jgi:hypothetical protein
MRFVRLVVSHNVKQIVMSIEALFDKLSALTLTEVQLGCKLSSSWT